MSRVPVYRTAKCKRCDSETVAWHQGSSGKWYLVEVFKRDGELEADHRDFHSRYCGDPESHKREQDEIDATEAKKDHEYRREMKRRQEEIDRQNSERVFGWLNMTPAERAKRIEELERNIAAQNANPPTMDYMVEFNREIAARKAWETELKFHWAVRAREKGA